MNPDLLDRSMTILLQVLDQCNDVRGLAVRIAEIGVLVIQQLAIDEETLVMVET